MKYSILSIFAMFIISFVSCKQEPEATLGQVKIDDGIVQGSVEDSLTIFKGIPFAAPPVGDLRWKAPQPVKPWEGVKQTSEFGPVPIQGNDQNGKSEDCLYLNVWTPATSPEERFPVLVWIYGGGFSFGATSEPVYDGAALAKKGVVLVSIAYRVGQIGFLAHPELSAENPDKISGNYGILDQIAGLQWVKDNIAAFGGDPNQVTIFGESAGGISVSMLCASPFPKWWLFRSIQSRNIPWRKYENFRHCRTRRLGLCRKGRGKFDTKSEKHSNRRTSYGHGHGRRLAHYRRPCDSR